jgi:PAS domain S-box-containing protein
MVNGAGMPDRKSLAFLAGGGGMGALMRAHDWRTSPLGPPETWPGPLRAVVQLMLGNRQLMFVAWGPELAFLYNDGYAPTFGAKHPSGLGRPLRAVWSEIWDDIEPLVSKALAGEATYSENLHLVMERNGYPEDAWFTFSYSPLRDESGEVAGIFCAGIETTAGMLAERRAACRLALNERLRDLADPGEVMAAAADTLGSHLRVARVGYAEVDAAGWATVEREWNPGGLPTLVGRHRLDDYGPARIADMQSGRTVVIADFAADPRLTPADVAVHHGLGIRAQVVVPLVKAGSLVALLFVHASSPRRWHADEVTAIEDAAERTWAAVARARAEAGLRESEARLSFLDRLGAATAPLSDADAVLATTTRLLGEHLGVSICAYADMDEDEDGFTIRGDWAAPGSKSIVGRYRLADFGRLAVRNLSAGLPLVVRDNLRELAPEEAATFRSIGIAATICMPLVKRGRLAALMAVHDRAPRAWTEAELGLLHEVTARSWAHVERVGAEAELRESEARHRRMLEIETVAVVYFDMVGGITDANDAFLRLIGYTRAELEAGEVRYENLTPPNWTWRDGQTIQELLTTGHGGPFEKEYFRRDGSRMWILCASKMLDERTAVEFIIDVSERKAGDAALRESEDRLRLAAEAAEVGFWDVDLVNDVLVWPPRVKAMFGISPDAPVSMTDFYSGLHPDDREATAAAFTAAADPARRALYDVEYRTLGKEDGVTRWVAAKGRGVFDDAGRCVRVVGTAVDITRRKQAEEELARSRAALQSLNETLEARVREEVTAREAAQAQLAHAQRMEALGQLAGGIAHDINNVLQAVGGGASLIEKRPGDPASVRRLARMVGEAAERGSAVTRRLLAFSRRGDLRAEAVDPVSLLAGMREIFTHTLGAGIGIRVDADPNPPPLFADKGQLETVLVNLAANARDAMDGRGSITLAAAVEARPRARTASGTPSLKAGRYVRLTVADNGPGMPPEILVRATEPFFTTKPRGQGTGLGLAMARGFAEQSGGAFDIESAVGCGTAVSLWLPIADTPTAARDAVESHQVRTDRRSRILLVDDEALVRAITAEELEEAGFSILAVESSATALALLDAGEAVDLLVTDLSMPGMDGLELIREVQRRRPGLPAVLLTGFATNAAELAVGGAVSGTFSLLRKPVPPTELAERISVLVEGTGAPPLRHPARD